MACFVKLKDDCYILWSKGSDSPAENKLFNQSEVLVELQHQHVTLELISKVPSMSPEAILAWLETYGTSDLGKSVDKNFIAQYNSLGPQGTPLSVDEIIKLLS